MRAVISVIGKDMVGILANVTAKCAEYNINVTQVDQSIMDDLFAMVMLVEISKATVEFSRFSDEMQKIGEQMGLKIYVMHEDVFDSMHRI